MCLCRDRVLLTKRNAWARLRYASRSLRFCGMNPIGSHRWVVAVSALLAQYTKWVTINVVSSLMNRSTSAQSAKPDVDFNVNGRPISATQGTTIAAALLHAGIATRKSVSGEPRNALCAMGVCMECCATVDGIKHVRTCQVQVQPGMNVVSE